MEHDRQRTCSVILADIADAQGDVDAYMARYSAEQLTYGTIAPDVARRLLDAGRADAAFDIVTRARAAEEGTSFRMFRYDLDEVYEECLAKLDRHEEPARHLWQTFSQTLHARSLRAYLKLLPDFEDIEAEERALDLAEAHPHLGGAIAFLVGWPCPDRAARMVVARADELDGNAYETLSSAADALEAGHPLAASLMRRAMIEDALDGAKSKRYVIAPALHIARLIEAIRATTWNAPALVSGLVTGWIEDGTMIRLEENRRRDGAERQQVCRTALNGQTILPHCNAGFSWLPFERGVRVEPIVTRLKEHGISVSGAEPL